MPKTLWSLQFSSKPSSCSTSRLSWKSGADRNMICLPTFLWMGAWDRCSDALRRSSSLRFFWSIRCFLWFFRRSPSFSFSSASTCFAPASVCSTSPRKFRRSSSLASMALSISWVFGSCSLSLTQTECTSTTFSPTSFSNSSCSEERCFSESSWRSCSHLAFSCAICCSKCAMFCFILLVVAPLLRLISSYFCCNSSRICSVSCEFWIRNKLDSSSDVKTSSSCLDSSKYKGISSPLEYSTYWMYSASRSSCLGYFFFRLLASSSSCRSLASSSASRFGLRRPRLLSAAFSSKARSSASISAFS
mmetsp:Transcript_98333/g.228011  ORF Transcript_98333/g.228011 Transcript_98333/m.228011 type:complete len:304 (-) Transcript_98333:797-1708(-)